MVGGKDSVCFLPRQMCADKRPRWRPWQGRLKVYQKCLCGCMCGYAEVVIEKVIKKVCGRCGIGSSAETTWLASPGCG